MIYQCQSCLGLKVKKEGAFVVCPVCGHRENRNDYKINLAQTAWTVRMGYQYRDRYEKDYQKDKELRGRYSLVELAPIFTFMAQAVISGIAGNWAYDELKKIINRIGSDAVELKIRDREFKKLLSDETEMEKFIKYVTEYRNDTVSAPEEVKKAIGQDLVVKQKVREIMESPKMQETLRKKVILKKKQIKTSGKKTKERKKRGWGSRSSVFLFICTFA